MNLLEAIRSYVLDFLAAEGIDEAELTKEELNNIIRGVEFCVSDVMYEAMKDSLSFLELDRKEKK